jgi:hypothetical protein
VIWGSFVLSSSLVLVAIAWRRKVNRHE